MNKLMLQFPIDKSEFSINFEDKLVFSGSCFSDEISARFEKAGYSVYSDPFGTIFHPSAIAYNILNALDENPQERILQRDDVFLSWDASATVFGSTEEELRNNLQEARNTYRQQLLEAKVIFITFGTAWGYELNEIEEVVANCHKVPQEHFTKFLSSPYEIVQDWLLVIEKLKELNPNLQIVFTVSPVRHTKDGVVENNFSKARLIEAVQQLIQEENVNYFPSYELVMDVLRDYRFFKKDLVHPNELAVDYIWERVEETYFDAEQVETHKKVVGVKNGLNHQFIHSSSKAAEIHEQSMKEKQEALTKLYPSIKW